MYLSARILWHEGKDAGRLVEEATAADKIPLIGCAGGEKTQRGLHMKALFSGI
jgi:hypothetical protein